MSFDNIALTIEQILKPVGRGILISVRPNTLFANGKACGEDGIRVEIAALPNFDKIVVKIPGAKSPIEPEKLEKCNLSGQFIWVTLKGFSGRLWQDYKTKEVRLSASATKMEIVNADETDIDIFKEDDA